MKEEHINLEDINLLQESYKYFDEHPEEVYSKSNDNLYAHFHYVPKEQHATLRNYKTRYKQEHAKLKLSNDHRKKEIIQYIKKEKIIEKTESINPLHMLALLRTFKTIPIFIYCELFRKIIKEYGRPEDDTKKTYNYSYYDLFMEFFNELSVDKHSDKLLKFVGKVEKIYGQVHLDMLEEFEIGKYDQLDPEEYSFEINEVRGNIAKTIEFIGDLLIKHSDYTKPTLEKVRIRMLYYLFFEFNLRDTIIHLRDLDVIERDISKICVEWNRCYPDDVLEFADALSDYNNQTITKKFFDVLESEESEEVVIEVDEFDYDKDFSSEIKEFWDKRRKLYDDHQEETRFQSTEFYNPNQEYHLLMDLLAGSIMEKIPKCPKEKIVDWLWDWKAKNPKEPYYFT